MPSPAHRTAPTTGLTGHDGAFLAERLQAQACHAHGIQRRSSSFNKELVDPRCSYDHRE